MCPKKVKAFGRSLKRWLNAEDGGLAIIPEAFGSWVAGGCWVLARALHYWIGPSSTLKVIYSWSPSDEFAPKMPQHVVLKIGDCYLDGNGAWSEADLLRFWEEHEDLIEPELLRLDADELEAVDVQCPPWAPKDLAKALYRRFGPPENVFS